MSVRSIVRHPLSRLVASLSLVALASGLPARAEPAPAPAPTVPEGAPVPAAPVQVADATQPSNVVPAAGLVPAAAAAPAAEPAPAPTPPAPAPAAPVPTPPIPMAPAPVAPPATFELAPTPTAPAPVTVTTSVLGTVVTPQPVIPRPEEVTRRQSEYLNKRFDLAGHTHPTLKMSGGRKAIPVGPTARLAPGLSWDRLARMSPEEIKKRGVFPYVPLWHPLQEKGGMVFPPVQTGVLVGLDRNDMLFDLPDAYVPEFPAPLYLTSRPDLGDVSQGQLITQHNVDTLFRDILTPAQLEGLKLMLQKTPARHHNMSADRATEHPVAGVACMDCHVNGHTTAQFMLTPDMRPQSERFRVDTASLRGTFVQSWFGSKRALRSLEQFIPTETGAAYFDGDQVAAETQGARIFTPREVDAIAQFVRIVDFAPAPKLTASGALDKRQASEAELHGEKVFAQHCQSCHSGQALTDNQAHDLKVERFYDHVGSTRVGTPGRAEGSVKTPSLRGLKDSPPYLHDGRLLTIEDTVEFFNMVLQARLDKRERADLVQYLQAL
jgi:mono/diheme cytochrome c family protein